MDQLNVHEIVLIPPCNTYGDIMSIIALVWFLTELYNKVHIVIYGNAIFSYYAYFFRNTNNICIINNDEQINTIICNGAHVCNTYTGSWMSDQRNYLFYRQCPDKKVYFCDTNPIYNYWKNIERKYICKPNVILPLSNTEINSVVYYKMIGLTNEVRMNFFRYNRDSEIENSVAQNILTKYNLQKGDKYNIINSAGASPDIVHDLLLKIDNTYKCIDIHQLVEFTGWLCDLIENAMELHLIEGCNTNFIYYAQYRNIIRRNPVYFHVWARLRKWDQYKLDYSWRMMDTPRLDNWQFLMDKNVM